MTTIDFMQTVLDDLHPALALPALPAVAWFLFKSASSERQERVRYCVLALEYTLFGVAIAAHNIVALAVGLVLLIVALAITAFRPRRTRNLGSTSRG